jgi:2-hydroxychromene-2-carboxylate isomerase
MTQQFQDQGGAATMDPSPLLRWVTSTLMTRLSRPESLAKKRVKSEKKRISEGRAHVVEYFHQVDDGYSHLAAQILKSFISRYDVELVCHLVGGASGKNAPEPDLLRELSRYDSFHVAEEYGLEFPSTGVSPSESNVNLANSILAAQGASDFAARVAEIGQCLWSEDDVGLAALAEEYGTASAQRVEELILAGNARRHELQHYSGAMFYYEQEWYWGVDRLYHLEKRLAVLGADQQPGEPMLIPRPSLEAGELRDDGRLTLEVYPSLRSPYTAISFDGAVKLAEATGVELVVRPVLPMVMRGVPATRHKGIYIFSDAAREAREAGVPYGNFYDPIGDPVRRCYSLYPWACEQGRGNELISSFLSSAFAEGVNCNNDKGLQRVVEKAGLSWAAAKDCVGKPGWEEQLETNRLAMYEAGLWGVPSFRLLDENGAQLLALWGQDRLWLFAREIQRQLKKRLNSI